MVTEVFEKSQTVSRHFNIFGDTELLAHTTCALRRRGKLICRVRLNDRN